MRWNIATWRVFPGDRRLQLGINWFSDWRNTSRDFKSGGTDDAHSAPEAKSLGNYGLVPGIAGCSVFLCDVSVEAASYIAPCQNVGITAAIQDHGRFGHGLATGGNIWRC